MPQSASWEEEKLGFKPWQSDSRALPAGRVNVGSKMALPRTEKMLKGTNLHLGDELVLEHNNYSQQCCSINFKMTKRLDLKRSHHEKEMIIV